MSSHKVAAGFFGSHLSWTQRYEHVAKALGGPEYNENQAKEDWKSARATRTPPEAYLWLLDQHFALPETATKGVENDKGVDLMPIALTSSSLKKLQPLPRWCLLETATKVSGNETPSPDAQDNEHGRDSTLWFGDIPSGLASEKRLNEVLYTITPTSIAIPFVRKVVSMGYRAPSHEDDAKTAPWLGFAFVAFRDKQEAAEALQVFNGMDVFQEFPSICSEHGNWTIRAEWAQEKHQGPVTGGRKLGQRLAAAKHPPLGEQLFPTALPCHELGAALQRHYQATGLHVAEDCEPWVIAEVVKSFYRKYPRREIFAAGHEIPANFVTQLLKELRCTRWPPAPHRSGMQTEQYLVLHRGKPNRGFENLLELLEGLLAWADPDFGCNRIAVTKDFQGSPHIDYNDVTYQYAISLGSFDEGGELCVEGRNPAVVHVVNTHNRIARVDGRFVHWVRGFSGGDRFSLIFFSSAPECATELADPFDESFRPAGPMMADSLLESIRQK